MPSPRSRLNALEKARGGGETEYLFADLFEGTYTIRKEEMTGPEGEAWLEAWRGEVTARGNKPHLVILHRVN